MEQASSPANSPVKTTPKKKVARPPANHPSTIDMVKDAIQAVNEPKGVTASRIKSYICEKYKDIDPSSMKYRLRQALSKGLEKGIIVQSKSTADKPVLLSRFKLVKQKPAKKEKKLKEATEKKPKKTEKKEAKTTPKKPKPAKKVTAKKSPKKVKSTEKSKESKVKTKKEKTPVKKAVKPKAKTAKPKTPKTPKKSGKQ